MNKTKVNQQLITLFLKKTGPNSNSDSIGLSTEVNSNNVESAKTTEIIPSSTSSLPVIPSMSKLDIAYFINKFHGDKCLNEEDKYLILTSDFNLEESFTYPQSNLVHRRKKFNKQWMITFQWLVYSSSLNKSYCKHCFFLGKLEVGNGSHEKTTLGSIGFDRWNKALEYYKTHEDSNYHRNAVIHNEDLLAVLRNKKLSVTSQLNSFRKQEAEKNRKILKSIIDTIVLCGRQGIALRGHRDNGRIVEESSSDKNEGNFRALLAFRVQAGDSILKTHIDTAPSNAMYSSPIIQNELINICGEIILDTIVKRINAAKCFSVLADETTDIATMEQLTLCARYYDAQEKRMREDFLRFVPVKDLTGKGLADKILLSLEEIGVNLKYLRGQGYDGASNMSEKFKGVQTCIRETYPTAIYTHCASHRLNLGIGEACSVPEIQHTLNIMKKVQKFFSKSTKRTSVLSELIKTDSLLAKEKKRKLIKICVTRWVERHDCVIRFLDLLHVVVLALDKIKEEDGDKKSKIFSLLNNIKTPSFVIGLKRAAKLLSLSVSLSKQLQSPSVNMIACLDMVNEVTNILSNLRVNADQEFRVLFSEAQKICEQLDIEMGVPRKISRQRYRSNHPTNDPETFYRQSIFIPFLDFFISEMKNRFGSLDSNVSLLLQLLPANIANVVSPGIFADLLTFYEEDLVFHTHGFEGEFVRWKAKWAKKEAESFPKDAVSALDFVTPTLFPVISKLLKILSTIPVTTATPERTFSGLKRLKSYLRNNMVEDRLVGLALLSIHKDIAINVEDVIYMFSMKKNRVLNFIL